MKENSWETYVQLVSKMSGEVIDLTISDSDSFSEEEYEDNIHSSQSALNLIAAVSAPNTEIK